MPVIRYNRPDSSPVAILPRNVKNTDLSPLARLAHVALHLPDVQPDDLPSLLCLDDDTDITPLLNELAAAGLVEVIRHRGEDNEVLHIADHPLSPATRSTCVPCSRCSKCACEPNYNRYGTRIPHGSLLCLRCNIRASAEHDIAAWNARLDEGAIYATGSTSGLLHRWNCRSLTNSERVLALLDDNLACDDRDQELYRFQPPTLPTLHTAEELRPQRRRRSCQQCKPDPV